MEDIRDAYERFYRLRERYEHESNARTLSQTEEEALSKVFREDKFIESVGRVRGISAHVETGDVELLGLDKVAFRLTAESSAAAVYAARCVHLDRHAGTNPTHQPPQLAHRSGEPHRSRNRKG
jgi:hypothetical protein